MNSRRDEFTPYWAADSYALDREWGDAGAAGHVSMGIPVAAHSASDNVARVDSVRIVRAATGACVGTIARQFGSEQPVLAADRHAHGRELWISCIATGQSPLGMAAPKSGIARMGLLGDADAVCAAA